MWLQYICVMNIVRKTKAVKALLEVFEQTENALSVVALVKQLEQVMNKTTVYRILERLEGEGRLHSFMGKDGLKWYAKYEEGDALHHLKPHPHFQCRVCGKTSCLSIDVTIPSVPRHQIDSVELLMIGLCEGCLSK